MTDERRAYLLVMWCAMHVLNPGVRPILRPVKRHRRHGSYFMYEHPLFGAQRLSQHDADGLIEAGWCKVTPLDADYEYIMTTELGREVARKELS